MISLIVFTDNYQGHVWTFYTNGFSLHSNYIQELQIVTRRPRVQSLPLPSQSLLRQVKIKILAPYIIVTYRFEFGRDAECPLHPHIVGSLRVTNCVE